MKIAMSHIISKNSCLTMNNNKYKLGSEINLVSLPKNTIYSDKKPDDYECEFIGLIVGDGHIDNKSKRIRFINKSDDLRNHITDLYEKICIKYKKKFEKPYYYPSKSGFKKDNIVGYLDFKLSWFLQRINIYNNDKTKKIPEYILNTTIKNKLSFLEGYNKADGLKKNNCIYHFKNFKTNSPVLAQGLIFLIKETTNQEFNINVEEKIIDNIIRYYYSINLLSVSRFSKSKSLEKKELVLKKINEGLSQRKICEQTKISRTFIRYVQNGYEPKNIDTKCIKNNIIKKIINLKVVNDEYYEFKTKKNDKLLIGIGCGLYHIQTII